MADLKAARRAVEKAMALAGESRTHEDVSVREDTLRLAREAKDERVISSLARHAGLLSYHLADYRQAVRYYEEALAVAPADGHLYLALAEAYSATRRAPDLEQALRVLDNGLAVAREAGDAELVAMIRQSRERLADVR
jgi:tetratricopeptide (TPR) repeat protein